jgi:site-specific DNA recombinase
MGSLALEYWTDGLPRSEEPSVHFAAPGRTAAVYVRISDDQADDETGHKRGHGVKRQEADCRALAERRGWIVGGVYCDNDISASSGKPRPAYQRMLADLAGGIVNAVIVWDLDRLYRHPKDLEGFIELADQHRIALASVGGEVDLSTPQGRLTARIKGAVGKHETEQIARRTRRRLRENAEAGKSHGGRRPYGYEKGGMVIREDEARIIRDLAERILAGDALRELAAMLNDDQVPTVTGAPWGHDTIRTMMSGPHIAGLRLYKGKIAGKAAWPPILDRPVWEAVRARLLDPSRRPPGQSNTRRHLLSGLVRCGPCGGKMYPESTSRTGPSYRCDACRKTRIVLAPFESAVKQLVFAYLEREQVGPPAATDDPELADLDAQISAFEQRKRDIPATVATNLTLTPEQVAEQVSLMIAAVDAALAPLYVHRDARQSDRLTADVLAGLDPATLPEVWDELSLARQRSIIGLAVKGIIVVQPARRRGRGFDPSRIDVPAWREAGKRSA